MTKPTPTHLDYAEEAEAAQRAEAWPLGSTTYSHGLGCLAGVFLM